MNHENEKVCRFSAANFARSVAVSLVLLSSASTAFAASSAGQRESSSQNSPRGILGFNKGAWSGNATASVGAGFASVFQSGHTNEVDANTPANIIPFLGYDVNFSLSHMFGSIGVDLGYEVSYKLNNRLSFYMATEFSYYALLRNNATQQTDTGGFGSFAGFESTLQADHLFGLRNKFGVAMMENTLKM